MATKLRFARDPVIAEYSAPTSLVVRHGGFAAVVNAPVGDAISVEQAYGFISYKLGEAGEEQYYEKILKRFQEYLQGEFGNSKGVFTLLLRIKAKQGGLDIKQPIFTMQWENQRILFWDKVIKQAVASKLEGYVFDEIRLTNQTNTLEVGLETHFQDDVSVDFSAIQQVGKLVNASQLVSVIPLSAQALGIIDTLGSIFKLIFDSSTLKDKSQSKDVRFISNGKVDASKITHVMEFENSNSNVPFKLPINISFSVTRSKTPAAFDGTRFDQSKLSYTLIDTLTLPIGDKQYTLMDLLLQSTNDRDKTIKPFLSAMLAHKRYGEADAQGQCDDLYGSFNAYLSQADARSAMWAFLTKYGAYFDRDKVLQGPLKTELAAVGLTVA